MKQEDNKTVSQYYVRLRQQAIKCHFRDVDDNIRSKLLYTIRDNKLMRAVMMKQLNLQQLLDSASAWEDVECKALEINHNYVSIQVRMFDAYMSKNPTP